MPKRIKTPAISREYEFCSKYIEEIEAIEQDNDNKIAIGELERQLTKKISARADKDVRYLLDQIAGCVPRAIDGIVRIDPFKREKDWAVWGPLYKKGRGRQKRLGWVSLFVGYGEWAPGKLLGLVHPAGGRHERLKSFADKCRLKLTSTKYGWPKSEDSAIWLDKKLTRRTSLEELRREVEMEAKHVFKKLIPTLTKIVEQE